MAERVNEEELPVKKRKSFKEKAFQNPLVPIGKIRNLIRCKSRVCLYEEMTCVIVPGVPGSAWVFVIYFITV